MEIGIYDGQQLFAMCYKTVWSEFAKISIFLSVMWIIMNSVFTSKNDMDIPRTNNRKKCYQPTLITWGSLQITNFNGSTSTAGTPTYIQCLMDMERTQSVSYRFRLILICKWLEIRVDNRNVGHAMSLI